MASMSDVAAIMPLVYLAAGACLALLLAVARRGPVLSKNDHHHLLFFSLASVALSAYSLVTLPSGGNFWSGAIAVRGSGTLFGLVMLAGLAVSLLTVGATVSEQKLPAGETYALFLFSGCGMLLITFANDLLVLFIGVELMSLASYGLVGILRDQKRSQEAALKYFLLGAFASACWIFGQAYLYGETGRILETPSLRFGVIADAASRANFSIAGTLGLALVLCVLLFKLSAAPFHLWAPDVYEGAPSAVTGMLAVGAKAAALLGVARLAEITLAKNIRGVNGRETCLQLVEVLSFTSLIVGNCVALRQKSVKRLVAYSGVAHVGYLLIGIVSLVAGLKEAAYENLGFYLMGYSAATLGMLAVCSALERASDVRAQLTLDRLRGLGRTHPFLAFAMAAFLLGLAGIPPAAGFAGKVALFSSALAVKRLALVVGASLLSCVGAAYYLRLFCLLYLPPLPEQAPEAPHFDLPLCLAIGACLIVTLSLGCFPQYGLAWAHQTLSLLGT